MASAYYLYSMRRWTEAIAVASSKQPCAVNQPLILKPQAARLSGLEDKKVLAAAAKQGRVLVTHDRKTIPRHFAEFIPSKTYSGVLIVPQKLPMANVVDDLI